MPTKGEIRKVMATATPEKRSDFILTRESLKVQGVTPTEAWQIAYQLEFGGHASNEAAVLAAMQDLSKDGRDTDMDKAVRLSAAHQAKAHVRGLPNAHRATPKIRAADAAREAIELRTKAAKLMSDDPVKVEDFASSDAPAVTTVAWVAKHLEVDEKDIDKRTCPCPTAWGLLKWARLNTNDFWMKIWYAMIPPRSQMDDAAEGGKLADMPIRELIERLKEAPV